MRSGEKSWFWEILGGFLGGSSKMRKIGILGCSWCNFAAEVRKCAKLTCWGVPGAILRPSPENAQNVPSGVFLGPFGRQGMKMIKMSLSFVFGDLSLILSYIFQSIAYCFTWKFHLQSEAPLPSVNVLTC